MSAQAPVVSAKNAGFRRGFMTGRLGSRLFWPLLYFFAPALAKAVPQVDPYLSRAMSALFDQGRSLAGRAAAESLLKWLDDDGCIDQPKAKFSEPVEQPLEVVQALASGRSPCAERRRISASKSRARR